VTWVASVRKVPGVIVNEETTDAEVDHLVSSLDITYKTVAAFLVIAGVKLGQFQLGTKMDLTCKRQAHYYWFIVANYCAAFARDGAYTHKGVEATVPSVGGESNADKVHSLAIEKMQGLEVALEVDAEELVSSYRNYFFFYRAPTDEAGAE